MSQQEFSYFNPEQVTDYKPRNINDYPRELHAEQQQQEQTVYYVTPEQSMLRGEKLIPVRRTQSYANWIATAVFLLMILLGGLIWSIDARASRHGAYYLPGKPPIHSLQWEHKHPPRELGPPPKWDPDFPPPEWDEDPPGPPDR